MPQLSVLDSGPYTFEKNVHPGDVECPKVTATSLVGLCYFQVTFSLLISFLIVPSRNYKGY